MEDAREHRPGRKGVGKLSSDLNREGINRHLTYAKQSNNEEDMSVAGLIGL